MADLTSPEDSMCLKGGRTSEIKQCNEMAGKQSSKGRLRPQISPGNSIF